MVTSNNCLVKARPHLSEKVYREVVDRARTLQEDTGLHEKAAIAKAAEESLQQVERKLEPKQSKARDVTQTEAFKKWFGDSKVVDAEGKPLVVYHGTSEREDFSEFEHDGRGVWFTEDDEEAGDYARWHGDRGSHSPRVMPVYLSISNPYKPNAPEERAWRDATASDDGFEEVERKLLKKARAGGHDGIEFSQGYWVAMEPEQIKSAIGNDGSFDPESADITRSPERALDYNPNLKRGQVLKMTEEEVKLYEKEGEAAKEASTLWGDGMRKVRAVLMERAKENGAKANVQVDDRLAKAFADSMGPELVREGKEFDVNTHEFFAPYRQKAAEVTEMRKRSTEIRVQRFGPPEFEGMQQLKDFPRPQTETPEFKRWFDGSRVVDAEGRPLIAFHGTNQDFDKFRTVLDAKDRQLSNNNWFGQLGSWFAAPSPNSNEYEVGNAEFTAGEFADLRGSMDEEVSPGAAVYPVFLSIKNPYETEGYDDLTEQRDEAGSGKKFREKLEREGYDGVVVRDSSTDGGQYRDDWIAFYPNQIKSAIGNDGSFDPNDDDITRSASRESKPIFYSQLRLAIEQVPQRLSTMSAPQWKLWLDANASKLGVKKEEIEWSGVKDYLAMRGKDKVTAAELSAFVRDNGVQVKDVVLGGASRVEQSGRAWLVVDASGSEQRFDREDEARANAEAGTDSTKYAQYTVPGGENYREVLITLPERKVEVAGGKSAATMKFENDMIEKYGGSTFPSVYSKLSPTEIDKYEMLVREDRNSEKSDRAISDRGVNYKSNHWDQPNILAHLRLDDRIDAEGKRVLFINEIQSDWAQEGRKIGFEPPRFEQQGPLSFQVYDGAGKPFGSPVQTEAEAKRVVDHLKSGKTIPKAPFIADTKAWVSLALKRAIMMAVEGGYDRVAFINGQQAADLYDLSKRVDMVSVSPAGEGRYDVTVNLIDGGKQMFRDKSPEEVADTIGKELAERAIKASDDWVAANRAYRDELRKETSDEAELDRLRAARDAIETELTGEDLVVGGEGMRAFYDKIVPQVANDVLKKIGGGKVDEVDLAAAEKPRRIELEESPYGNTYTLVDADTGETYSMDKDGWVPEGEEGSIMSRKAAESLRSALAEGLPAMRQPGFEITDKMRAELEDGMPLFSAARAARDLDVGFGYKVSDFLDSSKKVSWWDKTVGTPYRLAQKYPTFKRVYDAIQNFIADVSKYATRAADLAPNILPKLEDMKDIFKSPISAEDVQALHDPIFKGTLVYMRDAGGDVVEAEDVGSAGIVWTDDELKSMWHLDDRQIGLYREFRKATNKSVADLAVTSMLRLAGEGAEGVRGRVLAATNVQQASEILADHLAWLAARDPKRANTLQNTARIIKEQADEARGLMARGYAPLSRYGDYTVYAPGIDENGYFEMFESERDANRRARELRAEFPDQKITVGTMSKEAHKLFKGITPETLALFGDALGLEESASDRESQVFQEYLKLSKSTRSAMKRLIKRKGVAGFSNDVGRVLAGFVYSNARQSAQNLNSGEILRSANEVPEGDLKDHAIRLVEYAQAPQEEMQGLRGLVFAQFIGGNVASALVNTTQSITTTWPTLSQYFGIGKSGKAMLDALGVIKSGPGDDADLKAAMERAAVDGITDPNETHQLQGQAQGRGSLKSGDGTPVGDTLAKLGNGLEKLKFVWGRGFGLAEVLNRKIAFISAYKLARDKGEQNPYEFAKKIVNDSQFVMNKGANPVWARGPVGATLFQFKKFSVFYLENLARMWGNGPEGKKAFAMSLAIMFLMAGAGGFPFAEDLDDVIDGFAQRVLNKSFSSKQAKKEFFAHILGDAGANFVLNGISGLPGAPIDVSGRLGLGNLIPATGLLVKKQNYGQDVQELFGAAGAQAGRVLQAAGAAAEGNVGGVVDGIVPVAVANALKMLDMIQMGQYRDQKGRKVIDTTLSEALLKGVGFQPASVKNVQDATRTQQELIGLNKARETEIADLWAKGRIERKPELIEDAKRQMKEWNAANPTSPITIDSNQINKRVQQANMSKAQRLAATAPKEIRKSVKEALQREGAE